MIEKSKNGKTIEAYDRNSQYYAKMFDVYGVRTKDIDRALKLNESGSKKVLELGCGNGRDAKYIISKVGNDNYVGVDASSGLLNIAKDNNQRADFRLGDMREIDVSPETLGAVFTFATVLHMNREELAEIIQKCHKWLKIGGILYIFSKYGEYKELKINNLGDEKYYYSYTPEDIKMMAGSGFEAVYSVIGDSDYGPAFTIALKKVRTSSLAI